MLREKMISVTGDSKSTANGKIFVFITLLHERICSV